MAKKKKGKVTLGDNRDKLKWRKERKAVKHAMYLGRDDKKSALKYCAHCKKPSAELVTVGKSKLCQRDSQRSRVISAYQ